MKPYYESDGIVIWNADCREILPTLEPVDLVLTDPPYPDYHVELYGYEDGIINFLKDIPCRQLVFWSAKVDFPLDYTAIHIWDKKTGCGSEYERIFERNGGIQFKMYRYYLINSTVAASFTGDRFTGHHSQKPAKLLRDLISKDKATTIFDPFMGSGSTLLAAKDLGRKCIGVEINEKWCEIAVKRLAQEVFDFG